MRGSNRDSEAEVNKIRDLSLFIAGGGEAEDLGLNKVKLVGPPL